MMKPTKGFLVAIAVLVLLAWLIVSWAYMLPPVCREHVRSWRACSWNLHEIEGAKAQWTEANHKTNGSPVDVAGVNLYTKGNRAPLCPEGGTYTYNSIGEPATCSKGTPVLKRVRTAFRVWEWQEHHE